jgi:hypothetical protein
MLERTSSPWSLLKRLWAVFSAKPDLGRSVLLREGYLYADQPELAFALVDLVSAQLLFSDKRIWIHRGERVLRAERTRSGGYAYADGPEQGQPVRLLLFDRVGTGELPEALHRDLRPLRGRLGFQELRMRHLSERAIVADLRYGSAWVTSLLETTGARTEFGCEILHERERDRVLSLRAEALRRQRVLGPLRAAMRAQVEEGLPFDEPLTEYGQQDGRLRRHWLRAYETDRHSYEFNGDRYYVFNAEGRPRVPQVCIDFITDTLERASGTWWRERGEPRERRLGQLDFGRFALENRRSVEHFLRFTEDTPRWFDAYRLPEHERIPFRRRDEFVRHLLSHADRYVPGDIVAIYGLRDDARMHYHSFFVYDTDPMTGFPTLLAANAGFPRVRSWRGEMRTAPRRSIVARIRPRLSWLESLLDVERSAGRPSDAAGTAG